MAMAMAMVMAMGMAIMMAMVNGNGDVDVDGDGDGDGDCDGNGDGDGYGNGDDYYFGGFLSIFYWPCIWSNFKLKRLSILQLSRKVHKMSTGGLGLELKD